MKKQLLLLLLISTCLTGCRSCYADYSQRKAGVQKVCPGCIYSVSERLHIAQDTTKQPNVVYEVTFCQGGFYYNAWDVDHLTRIQ